MARCNRSIVSLIMRFFNIMATNVDSNCNKVNSNGTDATNIFTSGLRSIKYQPPRNIKIEMEKWIKVAHNAWKTLWRSVDHWLQLKLLVLNAFNRCRYGANSARTQTVGVPVVELWVSVAANAFIFNWSQNLLGFRLLYYYTDTDCFTFAVELRVLGAFDQKVVVELNSRWTANVQPFVMSFSFMRPLFNSFPQWKMVSR